MIPGGHPPSAAGRYRADIDGLRAIAVLGVVAFHAGMPGVSGGFVGVDVFFVISGYLITGLLHGELVRSGTIDLAAFFSRRIRRLMPALVIVVLASLLVSFVSMFPREVHRLGKSAEAVSLLIANFHFRHFSGGYFDPSTDLMPLLHTWSLAVEEQYYLVWPPLLLLLFHAHGRNAAGGFHRNLILFLVAATLLSLAACIWQTGRQPQAAFYLMPYRAWEFAAGALISYWQPALEKRIRATHGNLLAGTGLMLIFGSMALLDDGAKFPGAVALPPVIGSAMVIAAGMAPGSFIFHRLLAHRVPVSIGLISYSLYLWHWPLLALQRNYLLGIRDPLRDALAIALAFVLAVLSYRLIEKPIREKRIKPFDTGRGTLRAGLLMTILVLFAAHGAMDWSKHASAGLVAKAVGLFGSKAGIGDRCDAKDGRVVLPAAQCMVGIAGTRPRLALWGDSHADHFSAALDAESSRMGISTLVRATGACPPLPLAVPFKRGDGRFQCGHYNASIVEELAALGRHGLRGVVLGGRWNAYLAQPVTEPGGTYPYALALDWRKLEKANDLRVGESPLDTPGSTAALEVALRDTLARMSAAGLRVLVVAPVPELPFSGPQCLYRRSPERCAIPRAFVEQRRARAMQVLRKVSGEFPSVRLWDPIAGFCDATTCHAQRDGHSLYNDDHHITRDMSLALGKGMRPHLRWLAGED